MIDALLRGLVKALIALRYRIRVHGLDEVARRGTRGILFLPNHPAMIDPVILIAALHRRFKARALADQDQIDKPLVRFLVRRAGVIPLPDVNRYGRQATPEILRKLDECATLLALGENVLLYPSGHLYRSMREDLHGSSAVERILRQVPDTRAVLLRTTGLWGSSFSYASGRRPDLMASLKKGALALLKNGVFLTPKRSVDITVFEPADFPRNAPREEINRTLEAYYNQETRPNTYVPYTVWEGGTARTAPEPPERTRSAAPADLNPEVRRQVLAYLRERTGFESVTDTDDLARDLGMDSLARMELAAWLEKEFGAPATDPDSLVNTADALAAAAGVPISRRPAEIPPPPPAWFGGPSERTPIASPPGRTITEAFLFQAARSPAKVITADPTSGGRTNRDMVLRILLLRGEIAREPDTTRVGILLPASVAADVAYLAVLFAEKTPVMLNWTTGSRAMRDAVDIAGVRQIITSRQLVSRLEAAGTDFDRVKDCFVFLEDMAGRFTRTRKLRAWLCSRSLPSSLERARPTETAAILFTSGSEAHPKAVPLTHANLLDNVRGILDAVRFRPTDRLIGFLPPFHSFGLTATMLTPLCGGVPVVHFANPSEPSVIARLIEAYRVTILVGTPTFLDGIVRAAGPGQLQSLRLAVTGAESCPERVYDLLVANCPHLAVLEGYGVTECSPVISVNREEDAARGTIGRPLPSYECVLLHPETGLPVVEPGAPGLLHVRGPSVFPGYLDHPGPSPFTEVGGRLFYNTGDLVSRDEGGVLTFRGRLKRFVKMGGEMVSLPAIEDVLDQTFQSSSHEGPVLAVEAAPGSGGAPEIVLFTILDITREQANQAMRKAGLSGLHNVRRTIRLDAIPVLGTGKTDYRALKARLSA